jgi:hypothetical protein
VNGDGDGDENAQLAARPNRCESMLSFQKLDVYRCAIELLALAASFRTPSKWFLEPYRAVAPGCVFGAAQCRRSGVEQRVAVAVAVHVNVYVYVNARAAADRGKFRGPFTVQAI